MKCKKCGTEIDQTSKFCSHCGEKTETKIEYQDLFASYRKEEVNPVNPYQEQQSRNRTIQYQENQAKEVTKNPLSWLALIFLALAISTLFFMPLLGIPLAIVSLVLSIVGKKHTSKGFGIFSLIISMMGFIVVMFGAPILFVANIEISLDDGNNVTIFEHLKGAFFCGYHQDEVYGSWKVADSKNLLVLKESGTYYLYEDEADRTDTYYYGNYQLTAGKELANGNTRYFDEDYYYYTITAHNEKVVSEGKEYPDTYLFLNSITLKLNKKNFSKVLFEEERSDVHLILNRSFLVG